MCANKVSVICLLSKCVCRLIIGGETAGGHREFVVAGEANQNGKLSVCPATLDGIKSLNNTNKH